MKNRICSALLLMATAFCATKADEITFNSVTFEPGEQAELVINANLTNANLTSYQFDIYLPEGISVAYDDDEEDYVYALSGRHKKDHTLSLQEHSDYGFWRFIVSSNSNKLIRSGEGELLTLTLQASATASGTHTVQVKNIKMAEPDQTSHVLNNTSFGLTVNSVVVNATSVSLDRTTLSLTSAEQTTRLIATVLPTNATNKSVTWTSSNTAVATVDASGLVTAKSNGTATITATTTDGSNKSATCEVTVNIPVATDEFTFNSVTIDSGDQAELVINATLSNANITSYQFDIYLPEGISVAYDDDEEDYVYALSGRHKKDHTLSLQEHSDYGFWRFIVSSNSNKLIRSGEGELLTLTLQASPTASGTHTVQVKNIKMAEPDQTSHVLNNASFGLTINTIVVNATSVSLDKTTLSFTSINQTTQLIATVLPSNATDKSVTWTSSNTSVATVDASGLVTAKSNGTATITATTTDGSNKSATCSVTVDAPILVTGVSLSQTSLTFSALNATQTLTATVTPSNAANKTLTWSSSNTNVATVSSSGVVTSKGNGTATITAKATDGSNLSATCSVTVSAPILVTGVSLSQTSLTFSALNATQTLTATVTPSNAANKTLTWTSSNTNVATVSSSGVVTSKGNGTATITATTTDGSNKSATCTVSVQSSEEAISEGYYTIVSAGKGPGYYTGTNPGDRYNDEGKYALYNDAGLVKWKEFDENDNSLIYHLTSDGDGAWYIYNLADNSYIDRQNAEGVPLGQSVYAGKVTTSTEKNTPQIIESTSQPGKWTIRFKGNEYVYGLTASHNGSKNGDVEPSTISIWGSAAEAAKYGVNVWYLIPAKVKASSISLDKTMSELISIGQTSQLTATVLPTNTTNKSVNWTSSNTAVAMVDANGLVTAKSNGTATITATTADGTNLQATCQVTVNIPILATSISLDKTTLSFTSAEQTSQLTATVLPSNATDKSVTWTSSNTAVATVDANGLVTAKANGTATITATTADGTNLQATCQVTVNIPILATSISLDKTSFLLSSVGQTSQLTATVLPSNATDKSVTWTSSNTSVATVDANGLVTAKANGTATITATTADGTTLNVTCKVTVNTEITGISEGYYFIVSAFDDYFNNFGHEKAVWEDTAKNLISYKNFDSENVEFVWYITFNTNSDAEGNEYWVQNYVSGHYVAKGTNWYASTTPLTPDPSEPQNIRLFTANKCFWGSRTYHNTSYCPLVPGFNSDHPIAKDDEGTLTSWGLWDDDSTKHSHFNLWYFRPVSDEQMVDFAEKKAQADRTAQIKDLVNQANDIYSKLFTYKSGDEGLITVAGGNWGIDMGGENTNIEGNQIAFYHIRGQGVAGSDDYQFLIDEHDSTYMQGSGYIDIDITANPQQIVTFTYTTRCASMEHGNANQHQWGVQERPNMVEIYASNDTVDNNWTLVGSTSLGTVTPAEYTNPFPPVSFTINLGETYGYLRYKVLNNANNGRYFTLSGFQVYPSVVDETTSQYYTIEGMSDRADRMKSLAKRYYAKVVSNNATNADVSILQAAVDAVKNPGSVMPYSVIYVVDGEIYTGNLYYEGEEIVPISNPVKEGYTFTGWNEIPRIMPAEDLTFTGSFKINKYLLTYTVDGEIVKSDSVVFATPITPLEVPTKEGYTFSGWSETLETMPANNVTVIGSFAVNQYKVTFKVDGKVYKTLTQSYGTAIIKPQAPSKEGYTFSGWQNVASTVPAQDVTYEANFTINKYKLKFVADGTVVSEKSVDYGSTITAPNAPTKTGYTFVNWGNVAATMPAKDVTYTAQYSINQYTVTFKVDGEVFKTLTQDYGSTISIPAAPTKEGYSFSGWQNVAKTVPAEDVVYEANFTVNQYTLKFVADGIVVSEKSMDYGSTINIPQAPAKEGYSFMSWGEVAETMPAKNVTYTAEYKVNQYKLTYLIDGRVYKTYMIDFDSKITPEDETEDDDYYYGWEDVPETMPAHDVEVNAYITKILGWAKSIDKNTNVYTLDGQQVLIPQKGNIYIINGKKVRY